MREKHLYLLLSDTGTILTRLIKTYTRMPYNHSSIAFDRNLREVYSFGRKKADNPFIGGFVKEDMDSVLFRQAKCAVYSLRVTDNQIKKIKQYIRKIEMEKDKYHYNFLGLFGVILNKPINRKKAFFCSQFVAAALKESNIIHESLNPSLIKPGDLPYLADFQLVFEGRLADYQNSKAGNVMHLRNHFRGKCVSFRSNAYL